MSDKIDLLEILLKAGLEMIIEVLLLKAGLEMIIEVLLRDLSFFPVVGLTGAGKSSLINAISNNKNLCEVSSEGESKTQKLQDFHFSIGDYKIFCY